MNRMMENKIKKDLEQSIKNSNDIVSNMSRFYTKTNKVIGNSRKIVFWKSTEGNEIVKVFFVWESLYNGRLVWYCRF